MTMANSILDRLWQKSEIDSVTNCWLYKGSNNSRSGHEKIRFNFRKEYVHRVSAHLHLGLDLEDKTLQALHKTECRNPNCWNPKHLYIGNHQNNMRDAVQSGRIVITRHNRFKTHCPYGHLLDRLRSSGQRWCSTCDKNRKELRKSLTK